MATVDEDSYNRRLLRLYNTWKAGKDEWGKLDAIVVPVGVDDDVVYSKSTALQTWLFGYELPDTVMVFCESSVYFLSSKKKIEFMKAIETKEENGLPKIKLLIRDKGDKDKGNFGKLIEALKSSKGGKTVGYFSKDKFPGEFMDSWRSVFNAEKFEMVDISQVFAAVMAVKEESELHTMKRAFQVSVDVLNKYLKDQIMDIVDGDRKTKHQKLAEGVEFTVSDKKYVNGVDTSQVEMCYPPIIHSGGNYSLKFSAVTDKNYLHFGSIVCCLGARYNEEVYTLLKKVKRWLEALEREDIRRKDELRSDNLERLEITIEIIRSKLKKLKEKVTASKRTDKPATKKRIERYYSAKSKEENLQKRLNMLSLNFALPANLHEAREVFKARKAFCEELATQASHLM